METYDAECTTTHKGDEDLTAQDDQENANEPSVLMDVLEDIEVTIDATTIDYVEDLTENENAVGQMCVSLVLSEERPDVNCCLHSLEDQRAQLRFGVGVVGLIQDLDTSKVEYKADNGLEEGLAQDHLEHVC